MQTISVHVGQCGNQLGAALLDRAAADAADATDPEFQQRVSDEFFRPPSPRRRSPGVADGSTSAGRPVARCVMVDMEPKALDAVAARADRVGRLRLPRARAVARAGGSANNWAVGYYRQGAATQAAVEEALRAEAERCDAIDGLHVLHSAAGGTGSGAGCAVADTVREMFPRGILRHTVVWPARRGEVATQWLNAALTLQVLREEADAVCVLSNDAALRAIGAAGRMSDLAGGSGVSPARKRLAGAASRGGGGVGAGFDEINAHLSEVLAGICLPARFAPVPVAPQAADRRPAAMRHAARGGPRQRGSAAGAPGAAMKNGDPSAASRAALEAAVAATALEAEATLAPAALPWAGAGHRALALAVNPDRRFFEAVDAAAAGGLGRGAHVSTLSDGFEALVPAALRGGAHGALASPFLPPALLLRGGGGGRGGTAGAGPSPHRRASPAAAAGEAEALSRAEAETAGCEAALLVLRGPGAWAAGYGALQAALVPHAYPSAAAAAAVATASGPGAPFRLLYRVAAAAPGGPSVVEAVAAAGAAFAPPAPRVGGDVSPAVWGPAGGGTAASQGAALPFTAGEMLPFTTGGPAALDAARAHPLATTTNIAGGSSAAVRSGGLTVPPALARHPFPWLTGVLVADGAPVAGRRFAGLYHNSDSLGARFGHCARQAERLLRAGAFVHHYTQNGVETGDLEEAVLATWRVAEDYGLPPLGAAGWDGCDGEGELADW